MCIKPLKRNPRRLYTEEEQDAVGIHISTKFGEYGVVAHETVSTDIRVDICIIDPTPRRNHYTLVTMGMGAHKMKVPKELRNKKLGRAEVLITLPPDWKVRNSDEKWYWPIRCLKSIARLPIRQDTWLGDGHTVSNGGPFAENTELSGSMLVAPHRFGQEATVCKLPGGGEVKFYQIVPLYEDEMDYKVEKGADALVELFRDDFDMVVDINRRNVLLNVA